MNSFDFGIISFLNHFAHRSHSVDYFITVIGTNTLAKGGVIASLIWWAWFRPGENKTRDREYLFFGILASFVSVLVARALADVLPFRVRPIHNAALHFQIPYHVNLANDVIDWSSFPSDHAALFFALATSIFFVSRGAGILALIHALFAVSLSRIYTGMHYPTDVLAGAAIGVGFASSAKIGALRTFTTRSAMWWLDKSPGTFYAFLFLLTFLVAVVFDPVRKIALVFFKVLEIAIRRLR